jgi:hypothetical protein
MRHLLTLMILTLPITSFGQYRSEGKGEKRSGGFIQYVYDGDLDPIVSTLRKDLGREEVKFENISGRQLKFTFKKTEWAEEKLEILFSAISNERKHIVSITCFNRKGKDYLNKTLPSRPLIEEYFNKIFHKDPSGGF